MSVAKICFTGISVSVTLIGVKSVVFMVYLEAQQTSNLTKTNIILSVKGSVLSAGAELDGRVNFQSNKQEGFANIT